MGIPRLTQDLQPYLEDAIVSVNATTPSAVRVQKLVIDAPSMVYHVYNKLAAYMIGQAQANRNIYNPPSYAELCLAVDHFLHELEDSGADIVRIYFDGGLPISKRSIRLDRLEKTRQQLEVSHVAHPTLDLRPASGQQEPTELDAALWKPGKPSSALTQLPFIVAAALEHLRQSKWSKTVFTVPGEADSYCAAAAKATSAAVLTNDSDFVLFDDMQDEGIVMLLNSLIKISDSGASKHRLIGGRCWRPAEIIKQLTVKRLLHLGFERFEDPSCSFLTVMQRAKALSSDDSIAEFLAFAEQFKSASRDNGSLSLASGVLSQEVIALDPRLAELVVQFEQAGRTQEGIDFHIYFPIVHEDPSRDASWSYGKSYRQLAYSILCQRSVTLRGSSSDSEDFYVEEFTRKGQRITKENVRLSTYQQLSDTLQQETENLRLLLLPAAIVQEQQRTTGYVLHGLRFVLSQRVTNGKQQLPANLVAQFLGLTPLQTKLVTTSRPQPVNSDNGEWALLHLNANVQATLYSIRMLKQGVDFVLSDDVTNEPQQSDDLKTVSSQVDTYVKDRLLELQRLLSTMPSIQGLFLGPADLAACMQSRPREELTSQIAGHFKELGVDLSAFLPPDESSNGSENENAEKGVFKEANKKKKRKKRKADTMNKTPSRPKNKVVRNMFDLLQADG